MSASNESSLESMAAKLEQRVAIAGEMLREESLKLETLNLGNADQKYTLEIRVNVLRQIYRELYEEFTRRNL